MIKKIFKQIWVERRHNSWLLLELMLVFFMLLVITDLLWVKLKNYTEPKGFDIENTYLLRLKNLARVAPGYVAPEGITQTSLEDLWSLVERVRQYPDIESVSISQHSRPYSMGGYWDRLCVDTVTNTSGIRGWRVTPSYFDVFRIRSIDGTPVRIEEAGYKQMVLTQDVAGQLFGDATRATGKEVYLTYDEERADPRRVAAVCNLMKRHDFMPYEAAFFEINTFKGQDSTLKATGLELHVRVKAGSAPHFEADFLSDMGERLKENNLYVSSVIPLSKFRDDIVGKIIRESVTQMVYVMTFVLITVFMGVFGVFWLRTRQRRGEIGVRMAMGATKAAIRYSMILESLCLMLLCVLPGTLVYVNMLYADIVDTYSLPFSLGRIAIVFTTASLIMILIIVCGTLWPANRAASIQPVDALRDE